MFRTPDRRHPQRAGSRGLGVLKRPRLARAYRAIKRLWVDGGYRNRLKTLVPDPLPLAVNGVERATIRYWLQGVCPRITGFHGAEPALLRAAKGLGASDQDIAHFTDYLRDAAKRKGEVVPLQKVTVACDHCPDNRRLRDIPPAQLKRAETRWREHHRQPLPRLRVRLQDGRVHAVPAVPCAAAARTNALDQARLNQTGRPGAKDKRLRRRPARNAAHNERIGRGHIAAGHLGKAWHLCPLCGLAKYERPGTANVGPIGCSGAVVTAST